MFYSKTTNYRIHNKPHGGTKVRMDILKFESADQVVLFRFACLSPDGFETIFLPIEQETAVRALSNNE